MCFCKFVYNFPYNFDSVRFVFVWHDRKCVVKMIENGNAKMNETRNRQM